MGWRLFLILALCSPGGFGIQAKDVGCYRKTNKDTILKVLLKQTRKEYQLSYREDGQKVTVKNLDCRFSNTVPHRFRCTGPDVEGNANFSMVVSLSDHIDDLANMNLIKTDEDDVIQVIRVKNSVGEKGFDAEWYFIDFFNRDEVFPGFCKIQR